MATNSINQYIQRRVKQSTRGVKHATANAWVERLERFGYLIRGLLYATIGVLALQLAFGRGGATTTPAGAIEALGNQAFGKILLILIVVGLASYALWGFVRVVFDPLNRGKDFKGLAARVGFAFSGLSYGLLIIPPLQFLMSQGGRQQASNPADISVQLFKLPFGMWLVAGLGLIWIGIGFSQLYTAYKVAFMKDFQVDKMSAPERKWAKRLGQIGYAARGVVFAIVGLLVLQAGLTHNPSQAQGFDSALLKLAQAPYGTLLLGVVALGLIAFGVYSALGARWIKVSGA